MEELPAVTDLPEPEPLAWHPGLAVQGRSSVRDILTTLQFVSSDTSYSSILTKFDMRRIRCVTQLKDYHSSELVSMLRGLEIKRPARVYIAAIAKAIGHDLNGVTKREGEDCVKAETEGQGST